MAGREPQVQDLGTSVGRRAAGPGSSSLAASRRRELEAPGTPQRFDVGARVEYRSETHKQWLGGVIQRVRENGTVYDLDVKKGAHVSKLRLARPPATSRSSAEEEHLVRAVSVPLEELAIAAQPSQSSASSAYPKARLRAPNTVPASTPWTDSGSATADSAQAPVEPVQGGRFVASRPTTPPREEADKGAGVSFRSRQSPYREALDLVPVDGENDTSLAVQPTISPAGASSSRMSRPPSAVSSSAPPRGRDRAPSDSPSVQDRRASLKLELARMNSMASGAQRDPASPMQKWMEDLSKDLSSRAGALALRKIVETTKGLVQGLEVSLIRRSGAVACCFHEWRCWVTLEKEDRKHEEELQHHHDRWEAHFENHRLSFEEELKASARREMTKKEKVHRQMGLLMDTWANGEKQGLLRQTALAWRADALKERALKKAAARIHKAVYTWLEGRVRGTLHSSFLSWRHLAVQELAERKKLQELEAFKETLEQAEEEKRLALERELAAKLGAMQDRLSDRLRNVSTVLLQWEKGRDKGSVAMAFQSWSQLAQARRARGRRSEVMQSQMLRWAEGEAKGTLHSTFLHWKSHATHFALLRETDQLKSLLTDSQKRQRELLEMHEAEMRKKKEEAKALVLLVFEKWEYGETKGTLKALMRAWSKAVMESKVFHRQRQSVHIALMKCVECDERGLLHALVLNWAAMAKAEAAVRREEERLASLEGQWQQFMEETQAEHQAHMNEKDLSLAQLKEKAHAVSTMILKQWVGGDTAGLVQTSFTEWRRLVTETHLKEEKFNTVKGALMRFIAGDEQGNLQRCFASWKHHVQMEAVTLREHRAAQAKIDELESRVQGLLAHREHFIVKYAEALGSSAGMLLAMAFSTWREECQGAKAFLEAQRQEELRLEELERQRQMAETRRKELRAVAAEALGCHKERVVRAEFFSAWLYLVEREKEAWVQQMNHNEAMLKYSSFVINSKLKSDDASLLAVTFEEWRRDAKHATHSKAVDNYEQHLQYTEGKAAQLERKCLEAEEELAQCYSQIDQITETLQKEIKGKEELATELRTAYDNLRQHRRHVAATVQDEWPAEEPITEQRRSPLEGEPSTALGLGGARYGGSPSSQGPPRSPAMERAKNVPRY